MKTKIKKILWFDITPRKSLYKELDECYEIINNQVHKIHQLGQDLSAKTNAYNLCQTTINSLVKNIEEYKNIIDNNNNTINGLQSLIKNLANQNAEPQTSLEKTPQNSNDGYESCSY